jgi:hypothetical protein
MKALALWMEIAGGAEVGATLVFLSLISGHGDCRRRA